MTDLHDRFRALDALRSPVQWHEIESRAVVTRRSSESSILITLTAAAVVLVVAIGAAGSIRPDPGGGPTQSPSSDPDVAGEWAPSEPMLEARSGHTATLLPDGRVLVAGGVRARAGLDSAELYDPRTGRWTATGRMIEGRAEHTATLLLDGTVLVTGGVSALDAAPGGDLELASAELYDPATGTWSATASMAEARMGPEAALLPDGRVLVVGGWGSTERFGPKSSSAELYDPVTATWTSAASMSVPRHGHSATLLWDGTVLVAGGYNDTGRLASAELYDPVTGTWVATGSLPEPFSGTATLLSSGMVLIAGGDVPFGGGAVGSAHAVVYGPATGIWTLTGPMLTARLGHAAALLPDGSVLVMGGRVNGGGKSPAFASAELYDPVAGTWAATADMALARSGHTAIVLLDGRVLVAGGVADRGDVPLASTELYEPGEGS